MAAAYGGYVSPAYSQPGRYGAGGGGVTSGGSASGSQSPGGSGEQLSKTNLYIRGLQPGTTDRELYNLCQSYGKITSTKAILDPATNTCKGYGFVDFESAQAAEHAVKQLQAIGMQAQMARVSLHSQAERDVTNLYIANLPVHVTETDLESMFQTFGQVVSTRILRDPHGFSRGVGFARMESKERCEEIIKAFNGKVLPRSGQSEPLLVKFADGGNRRKTPQYGNRPMWNERPPSENVSGGSYEPSTTQNGLTSSMTAQQQQQQQAVLTSPPLMQHGYSLAQATAPAVNHHTYQTMPTAGTWLQHPSAVSGAAPYILQHPMTTVISNMHPGLHAFDPSLLSAQMNQLYIAAAAQSNNDEQTNM